jgi:FkbM family methyltransferase
MGINWVHFPETQRRVLETPSAEYFTPFNRRPLSRMAEQHMLGTLNQRLDVNWWILRNSADFFTWRALKMRLSEAERRLPLIEYSLRGLEAPLLVRPHRLEDHGVVMEIFYFKVYELSAEFRNKFRTSSVLDCGANAGFFAAYLRMMAKSQIDTYVAVEPHPGNFALLQEQVRRQRPARRVSLYNIAISDRDGVIRFHWDTDNRAHRIAQNTGAVEVPTLSVSTLLDREGIDVLDLLKVDIEGGEKEILGSIDSWKDRVKVMLVELHPWIDKNLTFDWFASQMRLHGFIPFATPALDLQAPEPGYICVGIRNDVPLPPELTRIAATR